MTILLISMYFVSALAWAIYAGFRQRALCKTKELEVTCIVANFLFFPISVFIQMLKELFIY